MPKPNYVSLAGLVAAREIRDGDLLLWRHGPGLVSRLIAAIGRGEYSHAAMACWLGPDLMALETVQFVGGRAQPLAAQVARYPGRIDWWRPKQWIVDSGQWSATKAVHRMMAIVGRRYGWYSLFRLAVRRLPIVRLFARPPTDDDLENGYAPFCSQGVSIACYDGGVDLVENLAHHATEPSDVPRGGKVDYRGTLIP